MREDAKIVRLLIGAILQCPNVVESTRQWFIEYDRRIENGIFSQDDYENLLELLELHNREQDAAWGLLELKQKPPKRARSDELEASEVLISMKNKKRRL